MKANYKVVNNRQAQLKKGHLGLQTDGRMCLSHVPLLCHEDDGCN